MTADPITLSVVQGVLSAAQRAMTLDDGEDGPFERVCDWARLLQCRCSTGTLG